MSDHPIEEVLANMARLIKLGHTCYVKWTCVGCNDRCISDKPNVFNTGGYHHDKCGTVTFPEGINFLLVLKLGVKTI